MVKRKLFGAMKKRVQKGKTPIKKWGFRG